MATSKDTHIHVLFRDLYASYVSKNILVPILPNVAFDVHVQSTFSAASLQSKT